MESETSARRLSLGHSLSADHATSYYGQDAGLIKRQPLTDAKKEMLLRRLKDIPSPERVPLSDIDLPKRKAPSHMITGTSKTPVSKAQSWPLTPSPTFFRQMSSQYFSKELDTIMETIEEVDETSC